MEGEERQVADEVGGILAQWHIAQSTELRDVSCLVRGEREDRTTAVGPHGLAPLQQRVGLQLLPRWAVRDALQRNEAELVLTAELTRAVTDDARQRDDPAGWIGLVADSQVTALDVQALSRRGQGVCCSAVSEQLFPREDGRAAVQPPDAP